MIYNVLSYVAVTVFAIWLWNDSSAEHKDNLFYVAIIFSQIGFFLYSRRLDKLKDRISELENNKL